MRLIFPPQYEPRLNPIETQWGGGISNVSSPTGTLPLRRSWTGAINAIHLMRQDETGRIDAVPHTLARRHIMMRRHDPPCPAAGDASAIPTVWYGSMAPCGLAGWCGTAPSQRRAKFGIVRGERSDCNGRHHAQDAMRRAANAVCDRTVAYNIRTKTPTVSNVCRAALLDGPRMLPHLTLRRL